MFTRLDDHPITGNKEFAMSENLQSTPTPAAQPPQRRPAPSFFFPILLVVVGVLLLLHTTGMLPGFAWWRLWVLWPALLIMIGVDILLRRAPTLLRLLAALVVVVLLVGAAYLMLQPGSETARPIHTVVEPGRIETGTVEIDIGIGQLTIDPLGETTNWAEVDLFGNSAQEPVVTQFDNAARLEITQRDWSGWWFDESRWTVRLNPRVESALHVHVGIGQCTLNLTRLNVTRLEVDTGVAECTVNLPAGGEAGTIPVEIDGGVGQIDILVPEGVAAQIRLDPGLGGTRVDTQRFPEVGEELYRSANYETATYRLDVTVDLGVGSIEVK
jgi:hypothetical protein